MCLNRCALRGGVTTEFAGDSEQNGGNLSLGPVNIVEADKCEGFYMSYIECLRVRYLFYYRTAATLMVVVLQSCNCNSTIYSVTASLSSTLKFVVQFTWLHISHLTGGMEANGKEGGRFGCAKRLGSM